MKEESNEILKLKDNKDSKRKAVVFGIVFIFVILFVIIIALTLYKGDSEEKRPSNSNSNIENHFNYDYKYVIQTTLGADYFIYLLKDDTVKVVEKMPISEICGETDCIEFTGEFDYRETTIEFSDKSMEKVRNFFAELFDKKLTNYLNLKTVELNKEQKIIEMALLLNLEDKITFEEDLIFETKTKQLKNSSGKVIFEMSKTTIAPSDNEIVNKIGTYLNNIVETEWIALEEELSKLLASGLTFGEKDVIEFTLVLEDLDSYNIAFTYSMSGTIDSLVRNDKKGFVFNSANGEIFEYPGGRKVTEKVIEKIKSSEEYKNMSNALKTNWETILEELIYTTGSWYLKEDKIHFFISEEDISNSPMKGHVIEVEIENPFDYF